MSTPETTDADIRFSLLDLDLDEKPPVPARDPRPLTRPVAPASAPAPVVVQPGSPAALRAAGIAPAWGARPTAPTAPPARAVILVALVWVTREIGRWGAEALAVEARRAAAPAPVAPVEPLADFDAAVAYLQASATPVAPALAQGSTATPTAAPAPTTVRFEAYAVAGRVALVSPYLRGRQGTQCRDALKTAGARWDRHHGEEGAWHFSTSRLSDVRAILTRYYGTDGGPLPGVAPTQPTQPTIPGLSRASGGSTGVCPSCSAVAYAWTSPALPGGYVDACSAHAAEHMTDAIALHAPSSHAVTQPIPFVPAAELAAQRHEALTPTTTAPAPVEGAPMTALPEVDMSAVAVVDADLASTLGQAVAEGQYAASRSHLVRGGVLESEVNRGAGFNSASAYARASTATEATAAHYAQASRNAAPTPLPTAQQAAAQTLATRRPLSADLPADFRERLEAGRARLRQQASLARGTMTAEQKAKQDEAERAKRARQALDEAISLALGHSDGEYPHGCIAAWRPSGERRWSVVNDAAQRAGIEGPRKRSLRAVASDAVHAIERGGLKIATVVRGREWTVYRPAATTQVGESVGEASLVAKLVDDTLVVEGPADLCALVRSAFDRAQREALIGSEDVSAWLVGLLSSWRAVNTCYGRWIPPGTHTEQWCKLAAELKAASVPVPGKPAAVASRQDMEEEIVSGLHAEIEALVSRVRGQRDRAIAQSTEEARKDLGPVAAARAIGDIQDARTKLDMYEVLTGPLTAARATLATLEADLLPLVDDTALRGIALELY